MKEVLKIAGAFVGVLVGAGFASGRELLVFFVNFGIWGLIGTLLSAMLFIVLGMALARLGSRLSATSHKEVVYAICGKKLGFLVDGMITFFMFAVTVVMLAGAGALLDQHFSVPSALGSALVMCVVVVVVSLDIRRVITVIGSVTPFMIVATIGVATYAIATRETDFVVLDSIATGQPAAASYWWLGAFLYVSYNIVAGVPILAIMGGAASNERAAVWGGLLGGVVLGSLMLVMCLGLLSRLEDVSGLPMPILSLVTEISPFLSTMVALVILGMVINTAVGTLYSFSARFLKTGTPRFKLGSLLIAFLAYAGSLFGFVNLVGMVYPLFGYLGFFLMAAILTAWFQQRKVFQTLQS